MDPQCKLCSQAMEDHQHIFLDCPYAKEPRNLAMKNFQEDCPTEQIEAEISRVAKLCKKNSLYAQVYTVVWSEVVHEIWLQRCATVYQGSNLSAPQAAKQAITLHRRWVGKYNDASLGLRH